MQIGDVLDLLAQDLNDAAAGHEHTRWTREQLGAYVAEGVQTVFLKRPDLFTETVVVKVEPCTTVQDVCGCEKIYRVLGQSTESGRILYPLRKRASDGKTAWSGPSCPVSRQNFRLREYVVNPSTNTLELYPPVPAGMDIWVSLVCSKRPDFTKGEDTTIPEEAGVAAIQWALWRAHAIDAEVGSTAFTLAQQHETSFWRLIAFRYVEEKKETEGKNGRSV